MANTTAPNATRPNADEPRQPGQPKFQPVEQADDEEIALTQKHEDDSNETSGGRQPGKRKGTPGTDNPAPAPQSSRTRSHSQR